MHAVGGPYKTALTWDATGARGRDYVAVRCTQGVIIAKLFNRYFKLRLGYV